MSSDEMPTTKKRLRDMTPDERRAYNAAKVRKSRERQRAGLPGRAVIPANVRGVGVASLIQQGADDADFGQKTLSMSVGLAKRLQNTAKALNMTEAEINEMGLSAALDALELKHNNGQPFPAQEG